MKKQIMTIVVGPVFALGTTAAFAQSGVGIGGGAAGGPNGIYKDTPEGPKADFAAAANQTQKQGLTARVREWRRRSRSRAELRSLDLTSGDFGISPDTAKWEVSKPFWIA